MPRPRAAARKPAARTASADRVVRNGPNGRRKKSPGPKNLAVFAGASRDLAAAWLRFERLRWMVSYILFIPLNKKK
jgi:hypothetical protein